MASTKTLIVGVCFLVMTLLYSGESAEALQCYQCEGEPDGDCANAVISSMMVVECPGGIWANCYHSDVRTGAVRTFSRGCTKFTHTDLCTLLYRLAASNPTVMKVFSCNTCWKPKCNTLTPKK